MKKYILLYLALISLTAYAQDPNIMWQKTIGGSDRDFLDVFLKTNDGGFILGGTSESNISGEKTEDSNGLKDYWVVKINIDGVIEWQNTIGGAGDDDLNTLIKTSDGGYLLGGSSDSNISGDKTEDSRGGRDYWVVKIDSNGSFLWDKTYGGLVTDVATTMISDNNNGFFVVGYSY